MHVHIRFSRDHKKPGLIQPCLACLEIMVENVPTTSFFNWFIIQALILPGLPEGLLKKKAAEVAPEYGGSQC